MHVDSHAVNSITPNPKLTPGQLFGSLSKSAHPSGVDEILPQPPDKATPPSDVDLPPATLEGLRKAWGSDDPTYDLNVDGTVDVADLLQFLSGQPAAPAEPNQPPVLSAPDEAEGPVISVPPADETPDLAISNVPAADPIPDLTISNIPADQDPVVPDEPTDEVPDLKISNEADDVTPPPADPGISADDFADETEPELTVDGFREVWGSDDANYDLNKDGTVNVADLLRFLGNEAPASDPGEVADEAPELSLDGFAKVWGTDNADYDLDGNGTVNVADFLSFLSTQTGDGAPAPIANLVNTLQSKLDAGEIPPTISKPGLVRFVADRSAPEDPVARVAARARSVAGQLIDQFEKAGYDSQPPANVREITDSLGLDRMSNQIIMRALQSRYPAGLGVSVFG